MMDRLPITVIILAFNEEKNIEDCLRSVSGWVEDIFVVDSFSTDKTGQIVAKYAANTIQHKFEDYASQRNWALGNLPVKSAWALNLDADQRVTPELKEELFKVFSAGKEGGVDGFLIPTRTIFMGKWMRHGGHYPIYRSYLFRKGRGECERRKYHQHFVVDGRLLKLKGDVIDIITPDLYTFIERHNRWTSAEAEEIIAERSAGSRIVPRLFGNPIERRRWLRVNIYWRLPLFLRSFLYFFYRYFLMLGFLEGKEGFIFHFTQGLIVHFLVDAKIYERKHKL